MKTIAAQQRGLSMVELLIAMAISSVLIIGLTQVYIDHKRTYVFQQSQAMNLENSRFAVIVLDEILAKAGYRRDPRQSMAEAFAPVAALTQYCAPFAQGHAVTRLKQQGDAGQTGVCLRYQPAHDQETLCDGSEVSLSHNRAFTPAALSDTVYIALVFTPHSADAQQGSLSCITQRGPVELLTGIADLRMEFGVGDAQHKKLSASAPFKPAQHWTDADGPVRAVRYAVLAASRPYQRDGESQVYAQWLAHANSSVQARLTAQDQRRIYQVSTGTQALRNMLP